MSETMKQLREAVIIGEPDQARGPHTLYEEWIL